VTAVPCVMGERLEGIGHHRADVCTAGGIRWGPSRFAGDFRRRASL